MTQDAKVQPVAYLYHDARNTARTAIGYSQAFDGKGIDWQNGQPWPHRMELAQALDWITELGAMVLNLADENERLTDELRLCCELKRTYQEQAASERERLGMLRAFVVDDAIACTYQSLGQYRVALMRALSCDPAIRAKDKA